MSEQLQQSQLLTRQQNNVPIYISISDIPQVSYDTWGASVQVTQCDALWLIVHGEIICGWIDFRRVH